MDDDYDDDDDDDGALVLNVVSPTGSRLVCRRNNQ